MMVAINCPGCGMLLFTLPRVGFCLECPGCRATIEFVADDDKRETEERTQTEEG